MFDGRIVGTVEASTHDLVDLLVAWEAVWTKDVCTRPWVGGDVDFHLLFEGTNTIKRLLDPRTALPVPSGAMQARGGAVQVESI